MDAKIKLTLDEDMISPICNFSYSWGVNCGLSERDALRFTVAISEMISNIIQFAFPDDVRGYFEVSFHHTYSNIEVVISEVGQPLDPDRHRYRPESAIQDDNFEGAGFRLIRRFTDEFLFINKGKEGKEFRLSKKVKVHDIDQLLERGKTHRLSDLRVEVDSETTERDAYRVEEVKPSDAEDIARLIYRAYEYSYTKEDLYFPKKIEKTKWGKEKIGVITRASDGNSVGYFAIEIKEDSYIGEVREAVVAPSHRRRGVMSQMMSALIELAHTHHIEGLYGIAVTVHPISQRVNNKFGFTSTALMLAATKNPAFKGLHEDYPQPGSLVVDFLPISDRERKTVYLPKLYEDILRETYDSLGYSIRPKTVDSTSLANRSEIDLKVNYTSATSLIIVNKYGSDFRTVLSDMIQSLEDQKELHAVFLDLPLFNSSTPEQWKDIEDFGFIYAGLVPLFHRESDYLRMQKIYYDLDLDLVEVYSEFGKKIKSLISDEYNRDR